jgi:hypothetical protein
MPSGAENAKGSGRWFIRARPRPAGLRDRLAARVGWDCPLGLVGARRTRLDWMPVAGAVRYVRYSPALVAFIGGGPGWSATVVTGVRGRLCWLVPAWPPHGRVSRRGRELSRLVRHIARGVMRAARLESLEALARLQVRKLFLSRHLRGRRAPAQRPPDRAATQFLTRVGIVPPGSPFVSSQGGLVP